MVDVFSVSNGSSLQKNASPTKENNHLSYGFGSNQRPAEWLPEHLSTDQIRDAQVLEDDVLETRSHVTDLLRHSPPMQSRARRVSEVTTGYEHLTLHTTLIDVESATTKAHLTIPDISTSLLSRLSDGQKELYLDSAIALAKHVTDTTGLPFMIMKDGRSCVVSIKEDQPEFFKDSSSWKASVLVEDKKKPVEEMRDLGIVSFSYS